MRRQTIGWALMAGMILGVGGAVPPAFAQGGTRDSLTRQYRQLTPGQLKDLLGARDVLLVNVHIPYDGDIPGTDLSVPFDQVEKRISEFPPAKNAPIVVYCRSGPMSVTAARTLLQLGYTDVSILTGGMRAWTAAGYPLSGT